jgi:signal transduction histidine kinase
LSENNNGQKLGKILLVEDDPDTNKLIYEILNINKYDCSFCYNGKEALDYLKNSFCDLILMDIIMPELDGIQTAKTILRLEKTKNIPVIFLTVKTDEELIKESFDIGIVDFIQKPIKPLELIARIKSALKNKEEKDLLLKKQEKFLKKSDYLEKLSENLKHIDKMKDNLITYIAHDIRIPITSIRAFAEIILSQKGLPPNKKNEYLKTIINQVDNLNELINNLLNTFKKIAGPLELKKNRVNFVSLCETIFSGFKGEAERKNLSFELRIDTNIKDILCDHIKIKELLSNLLSNAIKYTDKGSINFNVFESDNYLCFEISDTGIGIGEKEIHKIFEKFYQINSIQNNKESSGLGLFIAKKIALAHNGDIYVESFVDKGTKFTFVLPKDDSLTNDRDVFLF